MEQIQQPLPEPEEQRVAQFCRFLDNVVTIEDLFDDGSAGDSEPRDPLPSAPSGNISRYHQEYFAPVHQLHPPMPVQAVGRQALRLVHSG